MLILRHPKLNHIWQQRITCYCQAELYVTIGDVKGRTGISDALPEFYFQCSVCDIIHPAKLLTTRDKLIVNSPALISENPCLTRNVYAAETISSSRQSL